jgi:hypothetical protein
MAALAFPQVGNWERSYVESGFKLHKRLLYGGFAASSLKTVFCQSSFVVVPISFEFAIALKAKEVVIQLPLVHTSHRQAAPTLTLPAQSQLRESPLEK